MNFIGMEALRWCKRSLFCVGHLATGLMSRKGIGLVGIGGIAILALLACPVDSDDGSGLTNPLIDQSASKITGIIPDVLVDEKELKSSPSPRFTYQVGSYIDAFEERLEYVLTHVEGLNKHGEVSQNTVSVVYFSRITINGKDYIINENGNHDYNFDFEPDFHVNDIHDALWVVAAESLIDEFYNDVLIPAIEIEDTKNRVQVLQYNGESHIRWGSIYAATEGFLLNILKYGRRNYKYFLTTKNEWRFVDALADRPETININAIADIDAENTIHSGFRITYSRRFWNEQNTWSRIRTAYHELGHGILRSGHPETKDINIMNARGQGGNNHDRAFLNRLMRNYVHQYLIPNNWPIVLNPTYWPKVLNGTVVPDLPDIWETIGPTQRVWICTETTWRVVCEWKVGTP